MVSVLWYIKQLLPAISSLIVAGAAIWGVSRYSIAARAETRLRESAKVEVETKIAQEFDTLMKTAESYGPTGLIQVGLASQLSALRSMVRITRDHPALKDAALAGFRVLRAHNSGHESIATLHAHLDQAIQDIEAVPSDDTKSKQ
jgi:hypothetical protein